MIALPCMLYSMDLTVLNLARPRLSADLQPSSSQLLWIVDIHGFFVAASLITTAFADSAHSQNAASSRSGMSETVLVTRTN